MTNVKQSGHKKDPSETSQKEEKGRKATMIHPSNHTQAAYGEVLPATGTVLYLPIVQIYGEKTLNTDKKRNKSIRMVQNIRKYGLSTPICVRPTEVFPGAYRYRITEGEELWHAALLAGLAQIPCRIVSEGKNDTEIESVFTKIRRKELHFLEQSTAFRLLVQQYGLTQTEIARRSGLSQSAVANKLRLMHLSESERAVILQKGLTERHARALLRLQEPQKRALALDRILSGKLAVSEAEALVEAILSGEKGISGQVGGQNVPDTALHPTKTASRGEGGGKSTAFAPRNGPEEPFSNTESHPRTSAKGPQTPTECGDFRPQRFILHTLRPLYNSLERTLAIFRKTGREAHMQTEEGADSIKITILIPRI